MWQHISYALCSLRDVDIDQVVEAIDFSKFLRDECAKYGLPYFDTSHDFDGQIEAARIYLLQTP